MKLLMGIQGLRTVQENVKVNRQMKDRRAAQKLEERKQAELKKGKKQEKK